MGLDSTKQTSKEASMKLQPLHDHILVKRDDADEKTATGIFLPTAHLEKTQTGTVLAVGFGKRVDGKLVPVCVTEGTKVLFSRYAGDEIKHDGEACVLLREADILAVLND